LNNGYASLDPVSRANALSRLAWTRFFEEASADEGLALGQSLGPAGRESVALALLGKGAWAVYQTDYASGKSLLDQSLRLFRELGYRWGVCETLTWSGLTLINQGDYQQAVPYLEESLGLARQAGDGNGIAFALWQLGRVAMGRGDYVRAMNNMTESLMLYKGLKMPGGVHFLLGDLGKAALENGDYQQAIAYSKEALTLHFESGRERHIAESLEQLARAAVMYRRSEHAARLLGAAEALRQSSGFSLFPYQTAEYDFTFALLREQLDEVTCQSRWAEGRAMSLDEAVAYALKELE
jgi:tetratricopeptide (TPR) repeat protein